MPRKKKNSSRKVTTNNSKQTVENMKFEIANEFGVNLGANASSRDNGIVGGEMTKRLVEKGKNKNKRSRTTKKSK